MIASDDGVPLSVVMPVHNSEKYLDEAIRSIRSQSMNAFRLVVVDDASTDRSFEIASAHAASDSRLRVIRLDQNVGNFAARNLGMAESVGRYIAVMDSDDISLPHRLSSQVAFMERNPDYIMISGGIDVMDFNGNVYRRQVRARDHYEVAWYSRFHYPMVHPAVMLRRHDPSGKEIRYRQDERSAQDYRLLVDLLDKGQTATLADVVLRYRIHKGQISVKSRTRQTDLCVEIATDLQRHSLPAEVYEALTPFRQAFYHGEFTGVEQARGMVRGLRQLVKFDSARRPDRRAWIEREGAFLMSQALFNVSRLPTMKRDLWMSRLAPTLAKPLLLRRLESAGLLPSFLRVDPVLAA